MLIRRLLWKHQSTFLGCVFLTLFLVFEWFNTIKIIPKSDFYSLFYVVFGFVFFFKAGWVVHSVFRPFMIRSHHDKERVLTSLSVGYFILVAQGFELMTSKIMIICYFGGLCIAYVFLEKWVKLFFVRFFACHHWVGISNALWCVNLGLLEPHRWVMGLFQLFGA